MVTQDNIKGNSIIVQERVCLYCNKKQLRQINVKRPFSYTYSNISRGLFHLHTQIYSYKPIFIQTYPQLV